MVYNRVMRAYRSMPSQAAITRKWNLSQINAAKIRSLSRRVKKAEGELKCYHIDADFTGASAVPNAAIGYEEITIISQGDGASNRDGNICQIKSVQIRGYYEHPGLDIYLVLSKNGQVPLYSNYTPVRYGYLYTDNQHDFRILKFLKNWTPAWAITGGPNQSTHTTHYQKLNIPVYYQGSSAQGIRNTLYLVVKNNTGVTPVEARFQVEVKFKDG